MQSSILFTGELFPRAMVEHVPSAKCGRDMGHGRGHGAIETSRREVCRFTGFLCEYCQFGRTVRGGGIGAESMLKLVKFCTHFTRVTIENTPYIFVSQNIKTTFATYPSKNPKPGFVPPPHKNPGSAPFGTFCPLRKGVYVLLI